MKTGKTSRMRYTCYLTVTLVILMFLHSCKKIEKLPPEPGIKFTSFELFDTTDILGNDTKGGRLKFYFEDGDGDLGLYPPSEGSTSDTSNLFFTLYRISGGVETPVVDNNDPLKPSDYRIPYLERKGQNKILRGTISVTFFYTFYSPADNDTIKYEFYIKDRAGNSSNTDSTCDIVLNDNGICYNAEN
jgi:hypothetical protein